MNRYIITHMQNRIFSFLMQDDQAVEIRCDTPAEDSLLGNIYIGRVKNIAANLGAAFVEIGGGCVCYLPLSDLLRPVYTKKGKSPKLQAGDELLVQVSREAIKSKFPSVTTNLMLHGKYILLTTGKTQISASSKLDRSEKERLIDLVRKLEADQSLFEGSEDSCQAEPVSPEPAVWSGAVSAANKAERGADLTENLIQPQCSAVQAKDSVQLQYDASPAEGSVQPQCRAAQAKDSAGITAALPGDSRLYGWLLRTNADKISAERLLPDMRRLVSQYRTLMKAAPYRPVFSCLFRCPPPWIARLSDLYEQSAEQIITDDPELFRAADEYLRAVQPEDLQKLSLYQDALLPLVKRFSLERQLSLALSQKVWLNSGGYLVIQPTEALTVIDVNTGKYEGGRNREKAFRKINREAAREAARQIRLRNLSGIIIIDFINMESSEAKEELLAFLGGELRRDPIRTVLVDMTKLSLVEITRQKKERPLSEDCGKLSF